MEKEKIDKTKIIDGLLEGLQNCKSLKGIQEKFDSNWCDVMSRQGKPLSEIASYPVSIQEQVEVSPVPFLKKFCSWRKKVFSFDGLYGFLEKYIDAILATSEPVEIPKPESPQPNDQEVEDLKIENQKQKEQIEALKMENAVLRRGKDNAAELRLLKTIHRVLGYIMPCKDENSKENIETVILEELSALGYEIIEYDGQNDEYFLIKPGIKPCIKIVSPSIVKSNTKEVICQGIVYKKD